MNNYPMVTEQWENTHTMFYLTVGFQVGLSWKAPQEKSSIMKNFCQMNRKKLPPPLLPDEADPNSSYPDYDRQSAKKQPINAQAI